MSQFIGYLIDGSNPNRSVPIAVATTKAECMGIAAQRALANAMINDSIGVQERNDIAPEVFADLGKLLEQHFGPDHCIIRKAD